ncbi:MAG: regulator of sigma E protease [bacterium]|jgi:regulator of sigma E protease
MGKKVCAKANFWNYKRDMTTIIIFIIVLGFLVFIHELGHYLAARAVGVKVEEFSIGFPPKMFSKIVNGTEYMISWIPLGGYVRLKGQNLDDEGNDEPDNYANKTALQRFFILVAGPCMNLIGALLIMSFAFFIGIEKNIALYEAPVLGEITKASKAEQLGLLKNDRIVSANGTPTKTWEQLQEVISKQQDKKIVLKIERKNRFFSIILQPKDFNNPKGLGWKIKIPAIIGSILPNSPAEKAGLLSDDQVLELDGVLIEDWSTLGTVIQKSKGQSLKIVVLRKNKQVNLTVQPHQIKAQKNTWIIGVRVKRKKVSYSISESLKRGTSYTVLLGVKTIQFVGKLVTGRGKKEDIGGPIIIAKEISNAAKRSMSDLLQLVAFISLQLGIFNLLPIPALDGGHILFLVLEKLKGSPLSIKFRGMVQSIGVSLLLILMVLVTIKDSFLVFFK